MAGRGTSLNSRSLKKSIASDWCVGIVVPMYQCVSAGPGVLRVLRHFCNGSEDDVPLAEEHQVREYLSKMDLPWSVDIGGMHLGLIS